MHILASISLGEYVEELHIPIDYWGIEEYKNSWAKSIADGIEKKKHSVLITSMHEPESLNFISAWIIYYDGEISYVQNKIIFVDDFPEFDTSKINEYVNKREIFNEDGFKISEWIVKTKDVIASNKKSIITVSLDSLKGYVVSWIASGEKLKLGFPVLKKG